MRRIRIGVVIISALVGLLGLGQTAAALTAADQAFLNKKIIAKWNITGKNQIEAAQSRGVDILEDHPNPANGYFTVLVSQDELDDLRKDGYSIDVIEPDWYTSFEAKSTQTMGGYPTRAEVIATIDSLHAAFPSITTDKFSIGLSGELREMWAIKISDNPNVDEAEPEILFTAIHHAREVITPLIILQTMRELLFNYGTDAEITNLVNEREIWFVPFVNPDGYVYNEFIAPSGGGMWRKNRTENIDFTYGTDPNRNYAYQWGLDDLGSSPTPSSDTYRGPAPFSEPENQNIRDFVNSRNFVIAVNFHSYSNLFLWAPGYADFYTTDEPLFQAIGDTVTSFNGYAAEPGWMLYNTNGDSDDWMYFEKGILSFTPEVGSGSDGFWPNPARIPTLVGENVPGNLILIDLADTPARIYPPALATWISPDTVNSPDFDLMWSDAGGINAAVAFELKELSGPAVVTDLTDNMDYWMSDGFSQSPSRAYSGTESFWGGSSNNRRARLVSRNYYTPQDNDTLRARIWYSIENNWDYAYVDVSSDYGQSWASLPGNITTNTNPNGTNRGNGITGASAGGVFVEGKFPLNAYVGDQILIRLSYETDGAVLNEGVYFDNIHPVMTFASEVTLDPATPNTTYPITGKVPGTYYYTLRSTDGQGQQGLVTPPHLVNVVNNTPSGSQVSVGLPEGVNVTFSQVDTEGMTTVSVSTGGPPPPAGVTIPGGDYYDISTTAAYVPPLTICLPYDPADLTGPEFELQLFHYVNDVWSDVTSSVDTALNVICGQVNSLSPFILAESDCLCSCHADPVCDGFINVQDVVETVNAAFRGGPITYDATCPHNPGGRTDVDCSGATNVVDVVRVVGVAFRGDSAAIEFCDPCVP